MTSPVIQFKRGALANLPGLQAGEPGFTTDSYDFYIGLTSETSTNKFFGSHRYWTKETTSTGSGVNFVEGTTNGTQYLTLKAPDSLSGITTFTLPGTDGSNGYVLTTNGSGTLSFSAPAASNFTIAGDTGTDTFNTGETLTFAGTAKEVNTAVTNNTVTIGLPDDVEITNNFKVSGISTFVGAVTFQGGTITLGDAATDNVVFAADVNSSILPNTDATYDLGNGSQRWNNANFAGIVTSTTFVGALTGTATTATRATTVDTTATSTNASYFVPFVDTLAGQNGETIRVGVGLSLNPLTGNVGVSSILSVGSASEVNAYIKAGGGSNAMYLSSNGDVLFQGKVVTNSIRSHSSASDALTLSGRDVTFGNNVVVTGIVTATTFVGNLALSNITGLGANVSTFLATPSSSNLASAVTDETGSGSLVFATSPTLVTPVLGAASATSLEVSGAVNVGTALSAPTVKTATIQHSNGTGAATIDTSGNITASQNLTVSGNLYVNGSTTQVNTSSMTVEDRTIELGQVDGSTPSSATTWDLGVLFNYNASGAKKSAVIWEHADSRFKFGSQVSDGGGTNNDSPQITVSNYAAIEIGALWVNDCAGQSQVISCSGSTRKLENITIDGGTF